MSQGDTALHRSTSRADIELLIEQGIDINFSNFNGQTALHVMVAKNRLECVITLLSNEAEIDLPDNNGSSPLHIAVENKLLSIVQCLVVFGCDINFANKYGKTARHMVGKVTQGTDAEKILYVLDSVGAKRCPEINTKCPAGCNAKGTYNGLPPKKLEISHSRQHIHEVLASTSKIPRPSSTNGSINKKLKESYNTTKIKTVDSSTDLIDFSSSDSTQRRENDMDLLLDIFKTNIIDTKYTAPSKEVFEDSDDEMLCIDPENEPENHKFGRGRLLCLDGGGIRGLILAQMLYEIELLSQTPISHLFDWIAGTSTGGILALTLGMGKTMKKCMCLYFRMKEKIFIGSKPYCNEKLGEVLKDNLGANTVMADITLPKIMVTAVMADHKPVDLHLFRNYKSASDILEIDASKTNCRTPQTQPEDQLIWKVACATGAAPSYFSSSERFIDGGLIANNPTLDAMTEIHEYNMALNTVGRHKEIAPISTVLSLGTGLVPSTEIENLDVFQPDHLLDTVKLAFGMSVLGEIFIDQATASNGRVVDRARAWCSMIGVPYLRLNPQMSEAIEMDEKNDQKLINMLWETKAYMYANRDKVLDIINNLT